MKVKFCQKSGLRKGKWSQEEDQQLIAYIERYRIWNWKEMAKAANLRRTGKSCRLRWMNYLKPSLKHGNFTEKENEIIVEMYKAMGSKWAKIASRLSGRSDNEIKNHWHTNLRKRRSKPNKLKKNHPNKENASVTYDEDQASRSNFIISMANGEPYSITTETNLASFETPFVSEQPLLVENYNSLFEIPFVSEQQLLLEDYDSSFETLFVSEQPLSVEDYVSSFETVPFVSEQPLSVEDYDIDESWTAVVPEYTSSSSLPMYSCSSYPLLTTENQYEDEMSASITNREQDENSYWDTMLMISEEEIPQFEGSLHGMFNDWE